jgi:ribosome recycling factor
VAEPDIDDIERRMRGAVEVLRREFAGLRTGRASTGMLDPVVVDAYDAAMPLNQVATVSATDARMLSVQVWDKGLVKSVEKAIREAGLGLNPVIDGQLIRLPFPELNEERRNELVKLAAKYTEQAKVAVRNVRHHGMDEIKKMEKTGDLSQDDHKFWADEIQRLTDEKVKTVDELFEARQGEIMQV